MLSCLPSDEVVLDTYKAPDGVFAHARGSVVIDMSRIHPVTSQEVSKLGRSVDLRSLM